MKKADLLEKLELSPIITAVKNDGGLRDALQTESEMVFVLFGNLQNICEIAAQIRGAGKLSIVHIDLVEGLALKETAVDFLADVVRADGMISTKISLLKKAKSRGMITVQRFFLLDSLSLQKMDQQSDYTAVDLVEILPGCMPKIIKKVCASVPVPVIAGGLIQEKEDVLQALRAGASGVSTTDISVWKM